MFSEKENIGPECALQERMDGRRGRGEVMSDGRRCGWRDSDEVDAHCIGDEMPGVCRDAAIGWTRKDEEPTRTRGVGRGTRNEKTQRNERERSWGKEEGGGADGKKHRR